MKNVKSTENIALSGDQSEKVFNLLENSGLNWTVEKKGLFGPEGERTGSFGVFKNGDQWLGTVGPQYTPLQNAELAETLVMAAKDMGLEFARGGHINGNTKVFFQAQLPEAFIGKSGMKRMLTAINSHDGTTSVGFGTTNTVIVCQNTFYRSYRDAGVTKIRHTATMQERIANAIDELRKSLAMEEVSLGQMKRMDATPLRDEAIQAVVNRIFRTDVSKNEDEVSTRKKNGIMQFAGALKTEIELEGNTLWGLFNAVTRYTNHIKAPKEAEQKAAYLMDGGGAYINNICFNEIMKWVDDNTAELVPAMK